MKSPEGYEKDDIKKYLKSIEAWFCCPYTAGFGNSGIPDILVCMQGQFIAIEVKREGKEPTPLQARRLEEIGRAGGWTVAGTAAKVIGWIEQCRKTNYM